MISCDTNVLLYALQPEGREYPIAQAFLDYHRDNRRFALCEQVLMELYVLLRNPTLFGKPYTALEAVKLVQSLRHSVSWQIVDDPGTLADEIWRRAAHPQFPRRSVYDARLALTLRHHGVTEFATRNTKHFEGYGFTKLINPIDA